MKASCSAAAAEGRFDGSRAASTSINARASTLSFALSKTGTRWPHPKASRMVRCHRKADEGSMPHLEEEHTARRSTWGQAVSQWALGIGSHWRL